MTKASELKELAELDLKIARINNRVEIIHNSPFLGMRGTVLSVLNPYYEVRWDNGTITRISKSLVKEI